MEDTVARALATLCSNDDDDDDDATRIDALETILVHVTPSNNVIPPSTVRDLVPSHGMGDLLPTLTAWMERRDVPGTYDDDNDDDDDDAVTPTTLGSLPRLPTVALVAAQLTAVLLALPGAVGVGWVQGPVVAAVSNVLVRWRLETSTTNNHNDAAAETAQGPKPRRTRWTQDSDEESDSDDGTDGCHSNNATKNNHAPPRRPPTWEALVVAGGRVAAAVAQWPRAREFAAWPVDVVQLVVGPSVGHALATAAALRAGMVTTKTRASGTIRNSKANKTTLRVVDPATDELLQAVVCEASEVLSLCGVGWGHGADEAHHPDDDDDDTAATAWRDDLTRRHDTVVVLLRSLHTTLLGREAVPHGTAGLEAAARVASDVLERLVVHVTRDLHDRPHRWPGVWNTPTTTKTTNTTPKTTPMATPTEPVTSPARRRRTPRTSLTPQRKTTPSTTKKTSNTTPSSSTLSLAHTPVLSALVGLLQQLSTHANLSHARRRTAVLDTIVAVAHQLPHHGIRHHHQTTSIRAHVWHFWSRQSRSRDPLHRLVAVGLAERILCGLLDNKTTTAIPTQPPPRTTTWSSEEDAARVLFDGTHTNIGAHDKDATVLLALVHSLQGRLGDKASTIRTASATAVAQILKALAATAVEAVLDEENGNNCNATPTTHYHGVVQSAMAAALPEGLLDAIRLRAATDAKATVRRAAVTALTEVWGMPQATIGLSGTTIPSDDVQLLGHVCHDATSVWVRTAAAQGLTRWLRQHHQGRRQCRVSRSRRDDVTSDAAAMVLLERTWASSVLPMVLDTEPGCAAKAVALWDQVVLTPLLSDNGDDDEAMDASGDGTHSGTARQSTAWRLLALPVQDGDEKHTEALKVAVRQTLSGATTATAITTDLFRTIYRVAVDTLNDETTDAPSTLFAPETAERRMGVWCLFEAAMSAKKPTEVARLLRRSKIDVDFMGDAWSRLLALFLSPTTRPDDKPALETCMKKCLQVLSQLASLVDPTVAHDTARTLQQLIAHGSLPPELVGSAIAALTATTLVSAGDDEQDAVALSQHDRCRAWIRPLYQQCERTMAAWFERNEESLDQSRVTALARAIYTTGELSMVGFSASDDGDDTSTSVRPTGDDASVLARGLHERPSQQLLEYVQAFMTHSLPGQECRATPESVRAHAFLALGKFCLRDESLTRRCLNLLARELQRPAAESSRERHWMVQSNSLLVLGDLCVKYTNTVDRFLPVMASCLQMGVTDMATTNTLDQTTCGGSAVVRKHAVLILSTLLLQDYIKWRGLLFHRFLVASADEDDTVAALAETVLFGPLLHKTPKLFSNNFVESLFVLNCCTAHPIYQAAAAMGDGGSGIAVGFEGINLTGDVGRVRRRAMYTSMLSKLSDEEKIVLTARIGREVLGGALQTGSELHRVCTGTATSGGDDDGAYNALSDALAVLSCREIRVGKGRGGSHGVDGDEEDDLEDPNVSVSHAKRASVAKGKLLSNVSRKHLIETLLPILCNLKTVLEKSCSPLLKDLMMYLVDIYTRYKVEARECLANDPTTLQEIEYDALQYRKAQRQPLTRTPGRTNQTGTPGTQPKSAAQRVHHGVALTQQ